MDNVTVSSEDKTVAYPKLKGSRKQLGWAYKIRARFAEVQPDSEILDTELEAKYWIDNRVKLIGDIKLPKSLPELQGTEKQSKWAFVIRARFAEAFPESALLRSHTDAKFWIENRRVFDFAIEGFRQAGKGCADSKEE